MPGICPNRVVFQFSRTRNPAYILPTVNLPFRSSGQIKSKQLLTIFIPNICWVIPSWVGISLSIIFFAWSGHSFVRVCLSSRSAWSISSAGLIFMLRFSLINANSVVVKLTFPSSVIGMFIRINFCELSQLKLSVWSRLTACAYLIGQPIGTLITEAKGWVHIPEHIIHLRVVYISGCVWIIFCPNSDVLIQVMGAQNGWVAGQVIKVIHNYGNE